VDTLFQDETARLGEIVRVTAAIEGGINAGKHVVIFTSRQVGYDLILLFLNIIIIRVRARFLSYYTFQSNFLKSASPRRRCRWSHLRDEGV
jgi:hypothetical protein